MLDARNVTAIVVTYNRLPLLKQCLAALRAQTVQGFTVLLVDNASTDGTADYIKTLAMPGLVCRNPGENLGGAGGFAGSLPPAGRWGAESESGDRVILMEAAPPPPDFKGGQVNEAPLREPEVQSAPPADSPSPKSAPPPPDTYKYRDGPDDGTHINKP